VELCIKCNIPLLGLPFFNNGDKEFIPSIPFCPNPKCERHGLLTVAYKGLKDKDEKNKHENV